MPTRAHLTALLALSLTACVDPVLSRVTAAHELVPPGTRAAEPVPEEVVVSLEVMAPASLDRLFAGRTGLVCYRVRTSLGAMRDCVTGASALAAAQESKALAHAYVPARRGDRLELEVVAAVKPTETTTETLKTVRSIVKGADALPIPGDYPRLVATVLGLAGEPADKTIGTALVLSVGADCDSATCHGVLDREGTFVLSYGLPARDRARVRLEHHALVDRDGDALPVPALVLHTRLVEFEDGMLSLDCRRALAQGEPGDGREPPPCVEMDRALPRQTSAWAELTRLTSRAHVKGLDLEEQSLVTRGLSAWRAGACGPGLAFPERSAPCATAARTQRQLETLVPDAEAIAQALDAARALEARGAVLERSTTQAWCDGLSELQALFETTEHAAARLADCGEDGCHRLERLGLLRKVGRRRLQDFAIGCFVERVEAARPRLSAGSRVLLSAVTRRAISDGAVVAPYEPAQPPTTPVLAETTRALEDASRSLPPTPQLRLFQSSWLGECERLATTHALLTGSAAALRDFVGLALRGPMDAVQQLEDPYYGDRIQAADRLLSELQVSELFERSREGLVLTDRARRLLVEARSLYLEFKHALEPRPVPLEVLR